MQGQNMRPYRDSAGWINMPSLGPPPSAAGPAEGNSGPPRRREYTFDVPDVNLYEPLIGIPPGSPVIDVWDGPVAALWQGGRGQEADEHNLVQSAGPSEGDSLPAGRPKKRKSRRESWEDERWQNVAGIPPPAPATVTPRRVPPSAAAGRRDGGPERLVFRDEDVGPLEGVSTRHLTRTPLAPLSRQGPSAAAGRRGGMERLEFSNDDDNNFLSSSYGPSVGRSAGDENPPLPRKRRRIIAGGQENQREVARSLPHSTTTRRRREGEGPSAAAGRRRGGRFEDVEIVGSSEEDNDTSSSDDDCPSDIGWPSGSSEEEMDIDYDDEEFMFARPTRRRSWKRRTHPNIIVSRGHIRYYTDNQEQQVAREALMDFLRSMVEDRPMLFQLLAKSGTKFDQNIPSRRISFARYGKGYCIPHSSGRGNRYLLSFIPNEWKNHTSDRAKSFNRQPRQRKQSRKWDAQRRRTSKKIHTIYIASVVQYVHPMVHNIDTFLDPTIPQQIYIGQHGEIAGVLRMRQYNLSGKRQKIHKIARSKKSKIFQVKVLRMKSHFDREQGEAFLMAYARRWNKLHPKGARFIITRTAGLDPGNNKELSKKAHQLAKDGTWIFKRSNRQHLRSVPAAGLSFRQLIDLPIHLMEDDIIRRYLTEEGRNIWRIKNNIEVY